MELPRDHRSMLCQQIATYIDSHPERKETAEKLLHFVLDTPDCFERGHAAGHITGSVWMLNPEGDKALLTLHHKLGRWMQTGGHADGDADLLRVALREAAEESGIDGITPVSTEIFDIDIHRIPANLQKGEPEHYHYDVRFLLRAPHEHFTVSPESDALAWWGEEDFRARAAELDSSVLRMAALAPGLAGE